MDDELGEITDLMRPECRTPEMVREYVRRVVSQELRRQRISRKRFADLCVMRDFTNGDPAVYLNDILKGKVPITRDMISRFAVELDLVVDNSSKSIFPYRDNITRGEVERVIGHPIEYEVWESQIGLMGIGLILKIFN